MSSMSVPPEVTMASSESVPSDLDPSPTVSAIVCVTTVSIVSVPPMLITESPVIVPPTESVERLLSKESSASTESIPPERVSSEELTESIPPERVSSVELTEIVLPPEVPKGSVPGETTTLSIVTTPSEVATGQSAPPEVTIASASTQSIPPIPTATSTLSVTSDLSALSMSTPPNPGALSPLLPVPSELATVSAPPKLTPVSTASAPPKSTPLSDPQESTKAQDDAIQLHSAFKGWGCDAARVVQTLAHRNATQRALIKKEYKTKFSEDLEKRLSSELSGDVKHAILLWMLDPARRDATIVRQSLQKLINKLQVVIEVICSRTPFQIQELKMAYGRMFDASLEQDIENHSSGDTKKLLLACVRTQRSEGPEVDSTMVDKDAKALYKDGQYVVGTNESTFIRIFSERSWPHLAAVSSAYRSMYVDSLGKAVKKETSWDFKCALLTILRCAENPGKYFAKVLYKAMKGLGTDEETLSRIIVSRAEVDIQQIKDEYQKKYKKTLSGVVHSETSGEYRTFLRSLLDPIIK